MYVFVAIAALSRGSEVVVVESAMLSLLLTAILVPLLMAVAERLDMVDRPAGSLKPQDHPVPYGGGIAVGIAFFLSLLIVRSAEPMLVAIGAMVVLVLGIVDDLHGVSPPLRVLLEVVAASTLAILWVPVPRGWLGASISVVSCAILGTASMNASNMTDGSDGLFGAVGLMAASGLLVGWLLVGSSGTAEAAAAVCGGMTGFLAFNCPPARVYLGDSGAYFVGFVLAALCIPALASPHGTLGVICIMAPLEVELIASVIRRLASRRRLMEGDRRHIYDLLRARGRRSARFLILIYSAIGIVSSCIGVLVWHGVSAVLGIIWIILLSGAVAMLYRKTSY